MLTVNCSDKQVVLHKQQIELSMFFFISFQHGEKEIWLPFSSNTIHDYFSFLLNNFTKIDLSGELPAFLDYISETKTVDELINIYIEKTDPANISDVTNFYEKLVKYVEVDRKNKITIYIGSIFCAHNRNKLAHSFGNDSELNVNLLIDSSTVQPLSHLRFHLFIPSCLALVKSKNYDEKYKKEFENTQFILKAMLKYYFYNRNSNLFNL